MGEQKVGKNVDAPQGVSNSTVSAIR